MSNTSTHVYKEIFPAKESEPVLGTTGIVIISIVGILFAIAYMPIKVKQWKNLINQFRK